MKKALASFLALFLILSVPVVFAQMPSGVPVVPAASASVDRIGVVAAAQGRVELKTPGQVGRIAQSGQPLFMGDAVTTNENGHLQILLLDETVFTIGPNSSITIDKFVYDPKSHVGEIKTSIAKGVFRYVSGKIAAKSPNNVTVKLPAATIGFRGTIVGGQVGAQGQGLLGLLGPGDNNDAGARNGSFTVQGSGGDHRDVNRTGFGVEIGANGGLSGVFQLSDEQINDLTHGLMPSGGGGQVGGGQGGGLGGNANMGDLSGENHALTGGNSDTAQGLAGLSDTNNDTSTTASQDAAANSEDVANGMTNMEQLTRITSGVYHYFTTGTYTPTYGPSGTMNAWCDIDFGSKIVGGGNSRVEIVQGYGSDSTGTGGTSGTSFANMSGPAVFSWTDIKGTSGTFNNIDLTLYNSNGVTANQATVTTSYTQNPGSYFGPASGSGSASGARVEGPSDAPPLR